MLKLRPLLLSFPLAILTDCACSLYVGLDCKFCKVRYLKIEKFYIFSIMWGLCWGENHNHKLDDEIKDRATLIKQLRKRNLGKQIKIESN